MLKQVKKKFSQNFLKQILKVFLAINILVSLLLLASFLDKKTKNDKVTFLAKTIVATCREDRGWRNCYGNELAKIDKKEPLLYTLSVMDEIQNIDDKTRDCHILAHKIAGEEVAKDPAKWLDILASIDQNYCQYGFIHGVLEGRERFDSNFELSSKTIPQICGAIVSKSHVGGSDQTCAHIMGHILLAENYGDIKKSVDTCRQIDNKLQHECFGGVFMENFTRDNLVSHGVSQYIPWNWDTVLNQEKLCKEYPGGPAGGCWQEISHLYNHLYPNQPASVYELCQRAGSEEFVNFCYQHAVATLILVKDPDTKYLESLCQKYEKQYNESIKCVTNVVRPLINSSVKFSDLALNYCGVVSSNYKPYCYNLIADLLKVRVSSGELETICSKIPESYKRICSNT